MSGLFDLSGRVSMVTGATKGLGRAIAQGLAEAGSDVVVSSRKQEACEIVAKEIRESTGREVLPIACHMGDWDAVGMLVERSYERFGKIDVVVNNAAINPGPTLVTEITSEYFDKLYQVNLKGPVRLAALTAARMAEAGGGSIINVTTVGSYHGGPGVSVYTACKAALLNMTRCMAAEWAATGVRVNALAPGPFLTEMMKGAEKFQPGFVEASAQATMQKRVADPKEIVGAVLFLAGDAGSYVTGEDLAVGGGYPT